MLATSELVQNKPEVVRAFVEASVEGWYSYLYGDPAPGNALILAALALVRPVGGGALVGADTPSFNVSAMLGTVDGQGRCWNLSQGHGRFTGGGTAPHRVAVRAVTATVPAGHALRLSLAGANFPGLVNPGTGAGPMNARAADGG